LILDEWLLAPLKNSQAMDVLEIVETRHQNASTIFCTQFATGGWHEKIGEETLPMRSWTGLSMILTRSLSTAGFRCGRGMG